MFINLLGYESDFGQMECLNLISRSSFVEKRIGYLGITQLFHEKSDILMMATHRMRQDIESNSQYVQATALQAFAQIATSDMCEAIGPDILKLISKGHDYISKKACLAGLRVVRKCPDIIDQFVQKLEKIFEVKNHGLLLSALALCIEVMETKPDTREKFEVFIPILVIATL